MLNFIHYRLRIAAIAVLAALGIAPAAAQSYPTRPITLVVPLPPGGTNDMMARAVADKIGAALGQQVVVENRPAGGSGTVATRAVARGPADGYTLLLGYTSTLATGPSMFANVGYDPRKDFAPIGLIASAPALLLVHPSMTVRNVSELIALMRSSPDPFQVGTPGISTVNHLAAVLFAQQAGVKLQHIPYKGSQPLITDLVGGHVKVGFNPIPVSRGALEGRSDPGARRHLAAAIEHVPGPAHHRGVGPARVRCGADLRADRSRRHAPPDHRAAEPGVARRARHRRGQAAARAGRCRADAYHARAACGRHRSRRRPSGRR